MKTIFVLLALWCCALRSLSAQSIDPTIDVHPALWNPLDNTGRLVNVSTRALAGSGDASLVVGFVVTEQSRYVLIRAIGPTLQRFGIANFLSKPRVTLYDASGAVVATAISWGASFGVLDKQGITLVASSVGAFTLPTDSNDAVIHRKLSPGGYTIVISSDDGQIGTTLAEVYASGTYSIPMP
jgi:hypothetical protein